jgi:hypothetical protein
VEITEMVEARSEAGKEESIGGGGVNIGEPITIS